MTVTITALERSPDGGKGLARDTRVRWALEEVGELYEVRLVSLRAMKEPAHLALHPFGQIPTYEEGDLAQAEIIGNARRISELGRQCRPRRSPARNRSHAHEDRCRRLIRGIMSRRLALQRSASGKGEPRPFASAETPPRAFQGRRSALNRHIGRRDEISTGFLPAVPTGQSARGSSRTETMAPLWRYRAWVSPWTTESPNSKPPFAPKMR